LNLKQIYDNTSSLYDDESYDEYDLSGDESENESSSDKS
jgi:hypothetical protein